MPISKDSCVGLIVAGIVRPIVNLGNTVKTVNTKICPNNIALQSKN